jgi:deoxyribonuclease-4
MRPLLGAHTSIAGGVHNALLDGKAIGATTIQLFTANQRTWASKPISPEEVARFIATLKETGLKQIMSHISYLVNLGSPKEAVREMSIRAFRQEIMRCQELGISYLNFHPGAALDSPKEVCLDAIVDALLSMEDIIVPKGSLCLLLETMAGQGSVIGASFDELWYIIDRVRDTLPIGVCMDTCHTFASGFDLRTKDALRETLDKFDEAIGLKYLKAMHLNDSEGEMGSHLDRHRPIGEGMIGKEGFSAIMQEPRLSSLPKILETPGGLDVWKHEIAWLLGQASQQ